MALQSQKPNNARCSRHGENIAIVRLLGSLVIIDCITGFISFITVYEQSRAGSTVVRARGLDIRGGSRLLQSQVSQSLIITKLVFD